MAAVHRACDGGQLEIAAKLLRLAEESMGSEPDARRRQQDLWALIAGYERLWHLTHDTSGDGRLLDVRYDHTGH